MNFLERLRGGGKNAGGKNYSGPLKFDEAIYPNRKTDFCDGPYGADQFDLSNAFHKGVVERGDVLEVTAYGKTEKLIYMWPDSHEPGEHHFFSDKPYAGTMPAEVILSHIDVWQKEGHVTKDEWNALIAEVKAQIKSGMK